MVPRLRGRCREPCISPIGRCEARRKSATALDRAGETVLASRTVKLSANDYRLAALERIEAARSLFGLQRYAECIYSPE